MTTPPPAETRSTTRSPDRAAIAFRDALPPSTMAKALRDRYHEDPSCEIKLTELSVRTGMSRTQLIRAFKRRYGLPPYRYLVHLRVDRAKEMLRAGQSPCRAAFANGFFDQSHFCRIFRRIVGTTPGRYAAVVREPKSEPGVEH